MPNDDALLRTDDGKLRTNWEDYLTSIDAVESLAGYDLFADLPDAVEYCVEAGVNGDNPDADIAPPVIQCGAADGAWHGDNVAIACTASDAESGLSHASDASFTLMTSVASGDQNANASTDTRVVCDAVGNCATAGPIASNMIDRKLPSASITTPVNGAVYQLNHSVIAAFGCADDGAGIATCVGTAANGSAIDTSSTGAKTFVVTATDTVGNSSSSTVGYTVATNAISINNIPSPAFIGGSFVPGFDYAGDGATSVTSSTPSVCVVSGPVVTFLAGHVHAGRSCNGNGEFRSGHRCGAVIRDQQARHDDQHREHSRRCGFGWQLHAGVRLRRQRADAPALGDTRGVQDSRRQQRQFVGSGVHDRGVGDAERHLPARRWPVAVVRSPIGRRGRDEMSRPLSITERLDIAVADHTAHRLHHRTVRREDRQREGVAAAAGLAAIRGRDLEPVAGRAVPQSVPRTTPCRCRISD